MASFIPIVASRGFKLISLCCCVLISLFCYTALLFSSTAAATCPALPWPTPRPPLSPACTGALPYPTTTLPSPLAPRRAPQALGPLVEAARPRYTTLYTSSTAAVTCAALPWPTPHPPLSPACTSALPYPTTTLPSPLARKLV